MSLSVKDMEDFYEAQETSERNKKILSIVLEAMNDWPVEVNNTDDFRSQLKKHIVGPVNKKNLEHALKTISIRKETWKAEALASVFLLYEHYDSEMSLAQIFKKLEKDLKDE